MEAPQAQWAGRGAVMEKACRKAERILPHPNDPDNTPIVIASVDIRAI